ncbi:MAG: hypothetical protein RL095_1380 [Verrucomicrobiota bacterium]|jgi:MoxR-like ATPase
MSQSSQEFISKVRTQVGHVVVGQQEVVERVLISLFTGGHLLLEGMPGLAKTLLVNTVAKAVDLKFGRVQFTIDMLPADILGSEILDQKSSEYRVHKGPIFTNLLLADEINRAAPKVQGALLEAMQERRVTIGGQTFKLPSPFLVIATQNPVEQSGTFELPEAQLDRFMMCHRLAYPSAEDEFGIVAQQMKLKLTRQADGTAMPQSAYDLIGKEGPAGSMEDLVAAMEGVTQVHLSEALTRSMVELVRLTRTHESLEMGAGPRAGLALAQTARARAFIHGRDYASAEDLFALAQDVLLHRIRLSYEAVAEGRSGRDILKQLIAKLG